MTYYSIIFSAAKAAKVSGLLLYAICGYESNNFTQTYLEEDHGSPSIGICMVKEKTAQMLGFRGNSKDLMDAKTNAYWAARYLKYQQDRYGDNDWVKLVSSYNLGTYQESKKYTGCPKNIEYIKRVQKHLDSENKERLNCGT